MADRSFIVDLILRARDETATAFASALANQEAWNALQKESQRVSEETARAHEAMTSRISTGQKELLDQQKALTTSEEALRSARSRAIDDQVRLEQAAQRYTKVVADTNRSEAERTQALQRLRAAQDQYALSYAEATGRIIEVENKRTGQTKQIADSESKAHARRIQELGVEEERRRRLQSQIETAAQQNIRLTKEAERAQQDLNTKVREYSQHIDRLTQLQRQRDAAASAGAGSEDLRRVDNDIAVARRKIDDLVRDIQKRSKQKFVFEYDLDTGKAKQKMLDLEVAKKELGRDLHINADMDIGAALSKIEVLRLAISRGLKGDNNDLSYWQRYSTSVQDAGNRVATFDNLLRGLTSLGIGVFFNQLIVLAGAAAGGLVALAGSAVYAGGALGGSLVAGIAQALPVLGVLGTAISRITAVWKAAQQQQLLQQQEHAKTAKTAKSVADATSGIANAEDNLSQAHKRVQQAQQGVIDARQKAIRQLQDLVLQERSAELAAKGAVLSQKEAQEALRQAISSGDTGAIARARLDVDQSQVGVRQARLDSRRTSAELSTRRSEGIEGSPEVTQAKQQLEAARQSAVQAQRALESARRTASITGDESLAAAGKLNFMLSQLSDAERKLYTQFTTFIDRFRVQGGKIAEPIINSVTGLFTRINSLLKDNRVIAGFTALAGDISKQLDRVFDHFSGSKGLGIILNFANQASQNLKPFTDIFINLADAFNGIAEAAGPALNTLLKYFADLTKRFADFTNTKKGQRDLTDFFNEGVRQFKSWMSLLGSLGRLFFSIINPKVGGGATTGRSLLDGLTKSINNLNKAANSKQGREFLQNFFKTSLQALSALRPILDAVAKGFASLFDSGGVSSVKAAADIVATILVPAFVDFLHVMGLVVQVADKLLHVPIVGQFVEMAVAGAALASVMVKLTQVFKPITAIFTSLRPGELRKGLDSVREGFVKMSGVVETGRLRLMYAKDAMVDGARNAGQFAKYLGVQVVNGARSAGTAMGSFAKGLAGAVATAIKQAATAVIGLGRAMIAAIAANPVLAAIAAVVAALVILELKFHIFEKALDGIKTAVRSVLNFIKEHWKDIITIMGGPMGLAVRLVIEHFDDIVGFFKKLPGRLAGFAKDAANAVVSAFEGVGEKIINGIIGGLKDLGGFAKSIANAFIDLLNAIIPNKIPVPLAPDIPLPDNPFPHIATGAYIAGDYNKGDVFPAMLAGDEAVLNPRQQDMIGRGKIMSVLRATGAQFLRSGGRYATGAIASERVLGSRTGTIGVQVNADADQDGQASRWRKMWQEILASTRRNAQDIEARIRDMRVNITKTLDRLHRDAAGLFSDTERSGKVHFGNLQDFIQTTMQSLDRAVYTGYKYIASATNAVLKGFDADTVKFSIDTPPTGNRAATGYIGMPGERGADAIPILVGRGEAVLNWAHQKMIEPALQAYYGMGLHDLFGRTSGYHAGGMGQMGYAQGGFTGPFGSGAAFTAVANFAKSKFGLNMSAGRTNHSYLTSTGNVSDHSKGLAGDFAIPGVNNPESHKDAFNQFWKSKLPQTIKQLIYRNKDQFTGYPIPDHMDHVHVALKPQYAFDKSRMAKILSRTMRGLSIEELLSNIVDGQGDSVDHIDPVKVKGKGLFPSLLRRIFSKARTAANLKLDSVFGSTYNTGSPIDYAEHGHGALSQGQVQNYIRRALDILNITKDTALFVRTFTRQAYRESTFNPNSINNWDSNAKAGNPSEGLLQLTISNFKQYMQRGYNNILGPLDNILASIKYTAARYGGGDYYKGAQVLWNRGGGAYARGGFVGGALRRAATGFLTQQDANRVHTIYRTGQYTPPQILPNDIEGLQKELNRDLAGMKKQIDNVKHLVGSTRIITKDLTEMTKDNGLLAQMATATQNFVAKLTTGLKNSTYKLTKSGIVTKLLSDSEISDRDIDNQRREITKFKNNLQTIDSALKKATRRLAQVDGAIKGLEGRGVKEVSDETADKIRKIDPGKRTDRQADQLKLHDLLDSRGDLIANQRALKTAQAQAQQEIADAIEALFQAQLDQFTKSVDNAVTNATAGGGANQRQLELAERVAQAYGNGGYFAQLENERIKVLKNQAGILANAIQDAKARGYTDLAQQYQEQFDELQTTILEATAQMLQTAIDTVNNTAQRSLASADRTNTLAGIIDRVGGNSGVLGSINAALGTNFGVGTGNALRTKALGQQYDTLINQRSGLQDLLKVAQSEGNLGAIDSLTDQLADLDASIAENIIAQKENTTAIRQSSIDAITARAQFQGGVFGNLLALTQSVATNTLTPDPTRQAQLLGQQRGSISGALSGLEDQLFQGFGVDVRGATGNKLVDLLSHLDYDGIEASLTQSDKEQFENLINGIIDNGSQLEANTAALNSLNGNLNPQSFTSSAWSWFRSAIFNGMGDVLPQYTIPSFDQGGTVIRSGIARVHPGDIAVMGNRGLDASMQEGDINIEINEAGGVPDPSYIAKRIAFERRTSRASR